MSSSKKTPTRLVHVAACVDAHWVREGRHRFELGFLVGQSDLSRAAQDVVLAAVEVPAEEPDLDHDVEIVQSFEDLSVDWVQEIAKQIDRLLPGGVHILGLYVVTSEDARAAVDQASVYLRAVAAAVALPAAFADSRADEHHCIVHVCTRTNTKSVRSFANLRDAVRTAAVPCELRAPSAAAELLTVDRYEASVALDEAISFSTFAATSASAGVDIAEKRLDELQQQLQPFVQRVWKARGVQTSTRGRIELVAPTTTINTTTTAASDTKSVGACRGVLQCVAFVPSGAPHAVELATYYLKQDLVKSLLLRIELLLERLSEDGGAAGDVVPALRDGGEVALPRRGLMKWCSGATPLSTHQRIQLSLHAFADDDQLQAVQTALEILSAGDELAGVDIDTVASSLTWLDSPSALPVVATPGGSPSQPPREAATQQATGTRLLFLVIPLLLAVVALLLAQRTM